MREVNEWNEYDGLACILMIVSVKDNSRLCQRSRLGVGEGEEEDGVWDRE